MDAIEKRARELLLSHYSAAGFEQGDPLAASDANAVAIKAIATALTPPEGYVLVPLLITDEMVMEFAEAWFSKTRPIDDCEMQDAWAAALAARPQVPS